jgi:hypothetical protein
MASKVLARDIANRLIAAMGRGEQFPWHRSSTGALSLELAHSRLTVDGSQFGRAGFWVSVEAKASGEELAFLDGRGTFARIARSDGSRAGPRSAVVRPAWGRNGHVAAPQRIHLLRRQPGPRVGDSGTWA